jgi:catechol 2,3-dioxygenase-like lactoylglutathione lyase family enzyme
VSDLARHKKLFTETFGFLNVMSDSAGEPIPSCCGVHGGESIKCEYDFYYMANSEPPMTIEVCRMVGKSVEGSTTEGVVTSAANTGATHIAFLVDDIKDTVDKLEKAGLKRVGEIITFPKGPGKGNLVAWLRDWDGHHYEIAQLASQPPTA